MKFWSRHVGWGLLLWWGSSSKIVEMEIPSIPSFVRYFLPRHSSSGPPSSTSCLRIPSPRSLLLTLGEEGFPKGEILPFLPILPEKGIFSGQKGITDHRGSSLWRVCIPLHFSMTFQGSRLSDGKYKSEKRIVSTHSEFVRVQGKVGSSIFSALIKKRVPRSVAVAIITTLSKGGVPWRSYMGKETFFSLLYKQRENPKTLESLFDRLCLVRFEKKGKQVSFYGYKPMGSSSPCFYSKGGERCEKSFFCKPLRSCRISSPFGVRCHPIYRSLRMHKGIDFAAPSGTPVYAAAEGIVEEMKLKSGYGNYIRISHRNGYCTAYAHLRGYASGMGRGKHVSQGQLIGYVGATGRVTAAHLHFELIKLFKGKKYPVNPLRVVQAKGESLLGRDRYHFQEYIRRVWTLYRALHTQEKEFP